MKNAWKNFWSVVAALVGAGMPIANSINNLAETLESGSRICKKSALNFEAEMDIDAIYTSERLRKAQLKAEMDVQNGNID